VKPDGLNDDAWILLVGYLALPYGKQAQKMAAGLVELLDGQGFEIRKKKK
jgi:hypothetical protein